MESGLGYVSCFAFKMADYMSKVGCHLFSSHTLLYGCVSRVLALVPYSCLIALTQGPTRRFEILECFQ